MVRQDLAAHAVRQARRGADAHADEHPVRVAVAPTTTTRSCSSSYGTELVLVGHEHSNDVDTTTGCAGAKHVQTNSSSYTIDHSPRGFRYVHMAGDGFDNPFRMYGVERALTLDQPEPGGGGAARGFREVQVNAYHTADEVERVRYRLDGGAWRAHDALR